LRKITRQSNGSPTNEVDGASKHIPTVRVRMYRQGLGDCFLLTFDPGGDEKHVLIDCGTLGCKSTDVKMADVIADIDKTSSGHLHLVVGTHQHQDHLSGFPKLQELFSNKKIAHLTTEGELA
jgi:glyoxylase-like metal-dependent hydrolase (beta-lactamase superfamily II)